MRKEFLVLSDGGACAGYLRLFSVPRREIMLFKEKKNQTKPTTRHDLCNSRARLPTCTNALGVRFGMFGFFVAVVMLPFHAEMNSLRPLVRQRVH